MKMLLEGEVAAANVPSLVIDAVKVQKPVVKKSRMPVLRPMLQTLGVDVVNVFVPVPAGVAVAVMVGGVLVMNISPAWSSMSRVRAASETVSVCELEVPPPGVVLKTVIEG